MLCRLACLLVAAPSCFAWVSDDIPWFDQYKTVTEMYRLPNGRMMRLPLRLHSHETVLTGSADLEKVKQDFEDEYYTPVSVGGKAAVQIWLNNFTDTDCGSDDTRNPYLETWTSTWVTPKDQPLELPHESDFSYIVADPKALIWIHRVICADAPGLPTETNDPALGAILGGHNVWGFPKSPVKAKIAYNYSEDGASVTFEAQHMGRIMGVGPYTYVPSIKAAVKLPETEPHHQALPINIRTPADAVVGGPLNMFQQVRFGEAFNTTQYLAPWDPASDSLQLGSDDYYSSVLKKWRFEPKVKMHSDDFQIVAFKPSNWVAAPASPVVV